MPIGFTDKPIQQSAGDTLGTGKYAAGLSEFILSCDTPMTISVQGEWGSGKTSVMNMIRENISEKAHTVWFNTWQFSQFQMEPDLSASLLSALLAQLGSKYVRKRDIYKVIGIVTHNFAHLLSDIKPMSSIAEKLLEKWGKRKIDAVKKLMRLHSEFSLCVESLLQREGKERLVVFIDDLDRIQPARAVELLEVIKTFMDCTNCVFVLAVDYEIVSRGIKEKYGDAIDEKKRRNFFDKIIQMPFTMPVAQFDNVTYISNLILDINGNFDPEKAKQYIQIIEQTVGADNPRELKRLFNKYLLSRNMLKNLYGETEFENEDRLLLATLCMQAEFEEVYEYFVQNTDYINCEFLWEVTDRGPEGDNKHRPIEELIHCPSPERAARIKSFLSTYGSMFDLSRIYYRTPHNLQYVDKVWNEEESLNRVAINSLKNILNTTKVSVVDMREENIRTADEVVCRINYEIMHDVGVKIERGTRIPVEPYRGKSPDTKRAVCGIAHFNKKGLYCKLCYTLYSRTFSDLELHITLHCDDLTKGAEFSEIFKKSPFREKCEKMENYGYTYARTIKTTDISEKTNFVYECVLKALEDVLRYGEE